MRPLHCPEPESARRPSPGGEVAEVHSGQGATLPRRRSRIPTATGGARHQAAARQGAEAELGTDSVDERLETLLHLLGGSRPGSIVNRYTGTGVTCRGFYQPHCSNNVCLGSHAGSAMMPGELVSGSPGDTLQYLSQLEMVARKLKHQLIKQKQVSWTRQKTVGN